MTRADELRVCCPMFHSGSGGSNPTSALSAKQLIFGACQLETAKQLNQIWHSRFPGFGGGNARVCYSAEANGLYYATAIWTNPSSRALPQRSWLMLKRFAISDDAPKNSASRMMGWMIRDIRKRISEVEWLVSYSDSDTHDGTIYQSSEWLRDSLTKRSGEGWNSRDRNYSGNHPCRWVQRWLFPMWLEFSNAKAT